MSKFQILLDETEKPKQRSTQLEEDSVSLEDFMGEETMESDDGELLPITLRDINPDWKKKAKEGGGTRYETDLMFTEPTITWSNYYSYSCQPIFDGDNHLIGIKVFAN